MGTYFRMSHRFDLCTPADFGLEETPDKDIAVDPTDGASWRRCALYDFGWGKENGYCKLPLPSFELLLELAVTGENREDQYGAAAIILDEYPDLLLAACEVMAQDPSQSESLKSLNAVFQLESGINHSPTTGKHYNDIRTDAARWQTLATYLKSLHPAKKKSFWPFG